ncbi:MAG: hypothetical protein OHK0044_16420 [Burkholderiaceae bacterium]
MFRSLVCTVCVAALAACAAPGAIAPGTAEAQVRAQFGRPTAEHALDAGAKRLEYLTGPFQQTKYMIDIDANGRVQRVEQVLTAERFARLRIGIDDRATVLREFGIPFYERPYPLAGLIAWMYPYKEDGVWNSEMAVYFDRQGVVRKVESGPDPRFIRNGSNRDR